MQSQLVFQEKNEIERLRVQNRLLSCYEAPAFESLFSEGRSLTVLDVGCNDGEKTFLRFSLPAVAKVIGLEYSDELARKAEESYGNERFSFYPLDVEAPDFTHRLEEIMRAQGLDGFDVIYLSFVLMHLADVDRLLRNLKPFLKEDGKLLIIEANDGASVLSNDENGLLGEFLDILKADKYSGNREVGAHMDETLSACGYDGIRVWSDAIAAGEGEMEKKQAIFTTFFSYLPEDVELLLGAAPENEEYRAWAAWLDRHYDALRQLILQEKSYISMGIRILTCTKGEA